VKGSDLVDRLDEWASRRRLRVRSRNPAAVAVRTVRRFIDVRVTGLAAEMTYYAILSLIPLITALGAGLGALEGLLGTARVEELEQTLVDSIEQVLSSELADDVAVPLVEELLRQQRTGVALGGLLVTLWLAGRIFRAAIRALDDTYRVDERRTFVQQWGLSMAFLVGGLVLAIVSLTVLVIGPLLGGGQQLADWLGLGGTAELLWDWGRWPLVGSVGVGFLTVLYRAGPNVSNTWRQCVPGAVLATVGLVAIAVGFRFYLDVAGPQGPEVGDAGEAVRIAAQLLGVALATLLFIWLSNISILVGGVFNAEWRRPENADRGRSDPAPVEVVGASSASDAFVAAEAAPAAPEHEREKPADDADDHQDDSDGVQVDSLDIGGDGEPEDRSDGHQKDAR
jgi:membrane protein